MKSLPRGYQIVVEAYLHSLSTSTGLAGLTSRGISPSLVLFRGSYPPLLPLPFPSLPCSCSFSLLRSLIFNNLPYTLIPPSLLVIHYNELLHDRPQPLRGSVAPAGAKRNRQAHGENQGRREADGEGERRPALRTGAERNRPRVPERKPHARVQHRQLRLHG